MSPVARRCLLLALAAGVGLGCHRDGARFRSRQPIHLALGAYEVPAGGRLALSATRLGHPDPTLRWEVLDGGGMVLPGGVFLAPRQTGTVRIKVFDPSSGEKADVRIQVVPDCVAGDASSVELYDPSLFTGKLVGRMREGRVNHAACLLADGTVLVSGGRSRPGGPALATAERFDPARGSWQPCLARGLARAGHSLTLLPDGTVLVLGGGTSVAERYDPVKDAYLPLGTCTAAEGPHQVLSLGSGDVLIVGSEVQRFNPKSGRFTAVGTEPGPGLAGASLTELPDGSVLVSGGVRSGEAVPQADLFRIDLAFHRIERKATLSRGRAWHGAQRMPGQKVLIYGGTPGPGAGPDAVDELDLETWTVKAGTPFEGTQAGAATIKLDDGRLVGLGAREGAGDKTATLLVPVAHQLQPLRELIMGRAGHTLTLLKDGRILAAGGYEKADKAAPSRAGARL